MPCDAKVGSNRSRSERVSRARYISWFSVHAFIAGTLSPRAGLPASSDLRLREQDCAGYDSARLSELLEIEVETIRAERPSRASDVSLVCHDDGSVAIRVALRDGSAELSGQVDPRGTEPAARTRLLALTISELLAQLWSERPPSKPAASDAPQATDVSPLEPRRPRTEFVPYAAVALRSMLEPRATLLGAALGAEYQFSSALALALSVEGAQGTVRSEHATVGVKLGSAALHASIGQRFGAFVLGVGPGARFGWVRFEPTELAPHTLGSTVSGAWAGPLLLARARWSTGWFVLYSSVEAGVVTLPVVGTVNGSASELELRGGWFAACAGIGARL